MTDEFMPDQPEDLSYEEFEDATWSAADDLEVIDLDKLDDAIETESEPPSDKATEGLFKTIETLGDEIVPPAPKALPSVRKIVRPAAPPPPSEPAAPVQAEVAQPAPAEPTPAAALAEEAPPAPAEPAPAPAPEESPPPEEPIVPAKRPEKASRAKSPRSHTRKAQQAAAKAAEPAPPAPVIEPPSPEPVPLAAVETIAAAGTGEAPPPAPPPDLIYQAQINLPPELIEQVNALRKAGEITAMPEPGIQLVIGFRAPDLDAVKAALAAWVQKHLPMQLEMNGIWAEVIGTQQYVAAWTLQPEKEIRAAQRSLNKALMPLVTPLPDAPAEFPVRVVIGDQVAAARYPSVIAQMQRDFEPEVWHATELKLIQHQTDAAPEAWQVAATFD